MSLWQAIGLTVLPNLGGFAGSLITRVQVKTCYEVMNLNGISTKILIGYNILHYNVFLYIILRNLRDQAGDHQIGYLLQYGLLYTLEWDMLRILY